MFATSIFANYASVMGATTQQGADTVITLDQENTVTLKNTLLGDLHQDDFSFI